MLLSVKQSTSKIKFCIVVWLKMKRTIYERIKDRIHSNYSSDRSKTPAERVITCRNLIASEFVLDGILANRAREPRSHKYSRHAISVSWPRTWSCKQACSSTPVAEYVAKNGSDVMLHLQDRCILCVNNCAWFWQVWACSASTLACCGVVWTWLHLIIADNRGEYLPRQYFLKLDCNNY